MEDAIHLTRTAQTRAPVQPWGWALLASGLFSAIIISLMILWCLCNRQKLEKKRVLFRAKKRGMRFPYGRSVYSTDKERFYSSFYQRKPLPYMSSFEVPSGRNRSKQALQIGSNFQLYPTPLPSVPNFRPMILYHEDSGLCTEQEYSDIEKVITMDEEEEEEASIHSQLNENIVGIQTAEQRLDNTGSRVSENSHGSHSLEERSKFSMMFVEEKSAL